MVQPEPEGLNQKIVSLYEEIYGVKKKLKTRNNTMINIFIGTSYCLKSTRVCFFFIWVSATGKTEIVTCVGKSDVEISKHMFYLFILQNEL